MALPVGIYDVLISVDGFSPTSRKIWVTPDGMMIFDAALEFNGLGLEMNRMPWLATNPDYAQNAPRPASIGVANDTLAD